MTAENYIIKIALIVSFVWRNSDELRRLIVKQEGPPRGKNIINQNEKRHVEKETVMKASRAAESGDDGGYTTMMMAPSIGDTSAADDTNQR